MEMHALKIESSTPPPSNVVAMTTIQGGAFHAVRARNTADATTKSAGFRTTLVHTG